MRDDALDVDFVAGTLEQQPPGGVAQYVEIPVVHGAQNALGLLLLSKAETRMNRADGVVEFAQQFVGIVERAVGQDIDFRGFQDADAAQSSVQLVDEADLPPEVFDRTRRARSSGSGNDR